MIQFHRCVAPLLAIVGLLTVLVLLGGGAVAEAHGTTDEEATAERGFNVSDPEPGDTVNVTMTVEMPSSGPLDYIDDFEPLFEDAEFITATDNGEPIVPIFADITNESAVILFDDDTGPGTIEIGYQVTIPSDATPGTVYDFDGTVQVNETAVPIDGPSELVVAGGSPPSFKVNINQSETDESVTAGETLDVAVMVENTGDEPGTQTITFNIDGIEEDDASATLGPGETEQGIFTYETSQEDVPAVEASVASDDDTAVTTIDVMEDLNPAQYELSGLDPESATVNPGDEPIDVTVTVTNTGGEAGVQDIALEVLDETGAVDYEDVVEEVATTPGDEETVTFGEVPAGTLGAGEYTHEVSSENDTIAGSLTVEDPDEARFELSNLDPVDALVTADADPIDVTVDIINVGGETGTQDIMLEVSDETGAVTYSDAVEDVTLAPDDGETVTFEEVPAGTLDTGEYTHEVSSENDTIAGSLTIEKPSQEANYQLSELAPESAAVTVGDEPLDLSVSVSNIGEERGSQAIELEVSNETETQYDDTVAAVEVNAGETELVTFEDVPVGELDPGTYTHEVSSANDTVAGSLTVDAQPNPAFFAVDVTAPESVVANESFSVTATAENTGDVDGTQTLTFTVGDDEITETLPLSAGEETSISFDEISFPSAGDRDIQLRSENDTATTTITILEEAAFEISIAEIPNTVTAGDSFTLTAEITNTGAIEDTREISFLIDGDAVGTESLTLTGGASETVSFSHSPTQDETELSVEVASSEDVATGTVTVTADTDTDDSDDGFGPGFGLIVVVVAMGVGMLLLTRRSRS